MEAVGYRAHYVIVDERKWSLYANDWGALTLARDVFEGPEAALRGFIAQPACAPGDWLDAVRCDGAVLIDLSRKRLLFFCTSLLCPELFLPATRRIYFEMLRARWPGWEIAWAYEGLFDLADAIGLPRSSVFYPFEPKEAPLELVVNADEPWTLVSILSPDVAPAHYPLYHPLGEILRCGPGLLERLAPLDSRATIALDEPVFEGGAVVDLGAHTVDYWRVAEHEPGVRTIIADRWPGWSGVFHEDAFEGHSARVAGTVAVGAGDKTEALRSVVQMLLRWTPDATAEVTSVAAMMIADDVPPSSFPPSSQRPSTPDEAAAWESVVREAAAAYGSQHAIAVPQEAAAP
jgi:hypothetical protein